VLDGWEWRRDEQRTRLWEAAYLHRVKKLPDLPGWLDPPRTRRLTPEQAEQARRDFEASVAASSSVPIQRPTRREVDSG
jgi:hypothetical protein